MTVDQNCNEVVSRFKMTHNCPVFGCSSSLGVYTPDGFKRVAYFLVAEDSDEIEIYPVIKMSSELTVLNSAKMTATEIKSKWQIQ